MFFFSRSGFRKNETCATSNVFLDTDWGMKCQLLAELRGIEEATLCDVLGKFVLPFMLVHVYMCADPKSYQSWFRIEKIVCVFMFHH